MATETPVLHAEHRLRTGKGAARQTRREGNVPGIVYGGGAEPTPINLKFNKLFKTLMEGRFLSTLFNLKIEGQDDVRVICRGVQRDVVKDLPTHVDLMRLNRTSRVNLLIPVVFKNQENSTGLSRGGVLTIVRSEIELVVTAGNIPEEIEVDLDGIDIGDVITISKVTLPANSQLTITDRDFVIANISAPSGLESIDEEVNEEEAVETIEF